MRRVVFGCLAVWSLAGCSDAESDTNLFASQTGASEGSPTSAATLTDSASADDGDTNDSDSASDTTDSGSSSSGGDGDATTADVSTGTDDGEGICTDGMAESSEICDDEDFFGVDCDDFTDGMYPQGSLICVDCVEIDASQCYNCGDGTKQEAEACDGTDFGTESCQSLGFEGGSLLCLSGCSQIDVSNCTAGATCGDGTIDPGEQCDGANLNGASCTSLGFSGGGTLSCNPTSCQYDVSQCVDGGGCTPLFGGCSFLDDNCCPGLTCIIGFGCLPE